MAPKNSLKSLGKNVTIEEFLAVVPYFARSRSIMEAAMELSIPANRLLEILDQLALIDVPGTYGTPAFRIKESGAFDKQLLSSVGLLSTPLKLSALEATTLLLVMESIEASSDGEGSAVAQSAADKLRRVVRGTTAIVDTVAESALHSFAYAAAVREALREKKALKIQYCNASGVESQRVIDVLATMKVEQTTYLKAVDRDDEKQSVKSFRADRIVAAEVTDQSAGYYPDVSVDPRDPHAFGADEDENRWARAKIAAEATWIADYEPVYFLEEAGDASTGTDADSPEFFAADIPMSNTDATVAFVLRRSPSVTVIEPVELRNAVVERASAALAEYGLDS